MAENKFLSAKKSFFQIPMKSLFEKGGSYTNFDGIRQKIPKGQILNSQALSIEDCVRFFKKEALELKTETAYFKQNHFLSDKRKVW